MPTQTPSRAVENRLSDSPASRFLQELFRNTGRYPIAIVLIESLNEKWVYFTKPDLYALILAAFLQAYWIASKPERPAWQRFLGNLIAPAVYTFNEVAIEGIRFFDKPHHIAYWIFAILIGLLEAFQSGAPSFISNSILIIKNVVYSQILFVSYIIFESYTNPKNAVFSWDFFSDTSHILIGLATLILGLSAGAADVNARNYLVILQETAGKLKIYSEWLLGRNLLGRALDDPNSMRLSRQKRTILFADIRGFTGWSESHSPEEVASLVNHYYATIEATFGRYRVVKFKFTADEAMAVFLEADEAVRAALDLRLQCERILNRHGLGAGIGLHTGQVVEGLLGSPQLRFYDALGDTVNTANRIEKSAASGEVWISEGVFSHLNSRVPVDEPQFITVKGKDQPVRVYRILT